MRRPLLFGMLALSLGLAGAQGPTPVAASAELRDTRGQVVGLAELREQTPGVVTLRVWLQGFRDAAPGEHGLHLHAVGSCAPTFAAAGGHFNPGTRKHGFLSSEGHHSGDLPNLRVDEGGNALLEVTTSQVTLGEGASSLFDADGSALVLHAGPDDHHTDPAGASGDRIACGVVTRGPLRVMTSARHAGPALPH